MDQRQENCHPINIYMAEQVFHFYLSQFPPGKYPVSERQLVPALLLDSLMVTDLPTVMDLPMVMDLPTVLDLLMVLDLLSV